MCFLKRGSAVTPSTVTTRTPPALTGLGMIEVLQQPEQDAGFTPATESMTAPDVRQLGSMIRAVQNTSSTRYTTAGDSISVHGRRRQPQEAQHRSSRSCPGGGSGSGSDFSSPRFLPRHNPLNSPSDMPSTVHSSVSAGTYCSGTAQEDRTPTTAFPYYMVDTASQTVSQPG